MGIAFTSIKGLTFYDSRRAFHGVTLFTPVDSTGVWMIDMMGKVVHYWEMGYKPASYGELLPNGNLLYAGKLEDGPLTDFEGGGGILLEVGWDGKKVWEYQDPYLHNSFYRMQNGNTLVIKWVKVPEEVASKVKGGVPGSEKDGVMWGDAIQEITPEGKVVWEWISHEHFDPETDKMCVLSPRSEWAHTNAVSELPDGNILTCFMKNDTVAIIDKKTGEIKWRWGTGDLGLSHPHCPYMLDNGNILIFDNGLHTALGLSRAVEIDPNLNGYKAIVGGYPKSLMPGGVGGEAVYTDNFWSPIMSSCQRLPNGNTLICESITGRIFEVNLDGELAWEYVNNLPSYGAAPNKTKPCMVYSAFRYGTDYPGLKRFVPVPDERQKMPGMQRAKIKEEQEKKELEILQSRLQGLGY